MVYRFIENTNSRKVGAMAVSYSPRQTCPDTCPLKNGKCYGENFPIKLHWDNYSNDLNDNYDRFIDEIKLYRKYNGNKIWRHNIVGDLVADKDFKINAKKLYQLIDANKKGDVICYTHHHTIKDKNGKNKLSLYNLNRIKEANELGFTINLSADTIDQAKQLYNKTKLPTAVSLPVTKNKTVLMYCNSILTLHTARFLSERGVKLGAIFDSDPTKTGYIEKFTRTAVLHPKNFLEDSESPENYIVIVVHSLPRIYAEIRKYLIELGFLKKSISMIDLSLEGILK